MLLADPSSSCLDRGAPGLAFEPACDRASGGAGWTARLLHRGRTGDQFFQTADCLVAIFLQAPEGLGLDDDHAILADAVITKLQQAVANQLG
jgi:hypothetical protein